MRTSRRILSRAALLATLLVVVFAVAAGAAATVVFDHHVVNLDGTTSYFYTVTWTAGTPIVNKVVFNLGRCYLDPDAPNVVQTGTWTTASPNACVTPPASELVTLLTHCEAGLQEPAPCALEYIANIGDTNPLSRNYCFIVNRGPAAELGPSAVSLIVADVNGLLVRPPAISGPPCSTPTAVTLADMRATAAGAPLAALGALALTGLAAFAAVRRRAA